MHTENEVLPKTNRQKLYQDYLGGEHWEKMRMAVLRRDSFKCVRCGSSASEVHHKRYRETPFDSVPGDLVSFCSRCHSSHHASRGECAKNKELFEQLRRADVACVIAEKKRISKMKQAAKWHTVEKFITPLPAYTYGRGARPTYARLG